MLYNVQCTVHMPMMVKKYLCKEAGMLIVMIDDGDYYDVKTYLCKEAGTRPH